MTDEATTSEVKKDDKENLTGMINVGEHSAYKSVEDLIKGKAEADKYISQLTKALKEKDEAIAELQRKGTIVDELKQIREKGMENTNTPDITEDTMKEIALKVLQDETKAKLESDNLTDCHNAVAGIASDVDLALKNKAQELGCTVEYLENIAKTSPKAFKSMFGIKNEVSFDSVNFLQSSRHISNETSNEQIDTASLKNPKAMASLFERAVKDPSMLNKIKTW
jgi:hypothetical protein